MFKDKVYRILIFIFIANFFFEENHAFLLKRIIYSAFIYLAAYQIFSYNVNAIQDRQLVRMPSYYYAHLTLFLTFIIISTCKDFLNPALNLVTLFNNPFALLCVVPVFIFSLGANSGDVNGLTIFLFPVCLVFLFTCVVKVPGRVPYFEAYVASQAILPFFIVSHLTKKYQLFAAATIIVAVPFSMVSDQRIILLKILIFFTLFFTLSAVRKYGIIKFFVLLAGGAVIFLMLTNLESILSFFKASIGSKGFDSNDTRSFLYEELFSDFKGRELILGRGFLGTYLSNYFLQLLLKMDDTGDFYQRFTNEVGFLELLLKGGYVFYVLYTLPLWYVSIKSIFGYAHVKISFYIGIYIFTELLLMFFGNGPYFSFQFSMIFFLAGYAYRMMTLDKGSVERMTLQLE